MKLALLQKTELRKRGIRHNVRGEPVFSVIAASWFVKSLVKLGKWRM
jgi:hypothetical protein